MTIISACAPIDAALNRIGMCPPERAGRSQRKRPTARDAENQVVEVERARRSRPLGRAIARSQGTAQIHARMNAKGVACSLPNQSPLISAATCHPRFRTYSHMAANCVVSVCWSCVGTFACRPTRGATPSGRKPLAEKAVETLDFAGLCDLAIAINPGSQPQLGRPTKS
jgi:hypothetical protein